LVSSKTLKAKNSLGEFIEEIHTSETPLPRKSSGQMESPSDLSPEVRSHLSEAAQRTFIANYNTALAETGDEAKAGHHAWDVVAEQFEQDEHGVWSKGKEKLI